MTFSRRMLMAAAGRARLDVADVFHIETRTGNGSTATVTGGFQPALSITKARSTTTGWRWVTTAGSSLDSSSTGALATEATGVTAFTSIGMTFGADADYNANTVTFVDYLLAEAPKFFDVVTWTGDGASGRNIAHNLGAVPGLIIIKKTSGSADWYVYHRSNGNTSHLILNTTAAVVTNATNPWSSTTPTDSVFTVNGSSGDVNVNGATYVAYLFAHDTSASGIVQCGGFTHVTSSEVNIGWEPQFVKIKRVDSTGNWEIYDSTRGFASSTSPRILYSNESFAEGSNNRGTIFTSTGLSFNSGLSDGDYIYMTIRAEGA